MGAPHTSADTPVMRQYLEIKARYPDTILMFRMGDFYEMFFDDAVEVAPVLDIAVTSRDKNSDDPVPMAGVPHHAVGGYVRTLVERGMKVAICDQMETPEQARKRRGSKIVHREAVRVITPGALVDEEHLRGEEPNYLVALVPEETMPGSAGLAALDISSGEFVAIRARDDTVARTEIARLAPAEIIAPEAAHAWLKAEFGLGCPRLEVADPSRLSDEARSHVRALAEESGVGAIEGVLESACALALAYAEATQPGRTLLLSRLRRHEPAAHLVLDETSLRNLEVFRTLRDEGTKGSLLWAIDATQTAMGGRLLRAWLGAPSCSIAQIRARHDAVGAALAEPVLRSQIQSFLKDVRDVMRLAGRACLGTITPRELGALRDSLAALPGLKEQLDDLASRRTDSSLPALLDLGDDLLPDLHERLLRYLVDRPPAVARDGGIVRDGADPALDEQRRLRDGGREALAGIEARERERTRIPSLRVQHNRVFGYFLEVPKAHLEKVPPEYVRKQTLANAERYVTEELAAHEAAVLGAQAEGLARELELFSDLREAVAAAGDRLCAVGERLAAMDVLVGLAEVAERQRYVRPELVEEPVLEIEEGRHPVVERTLASGRFVPNDVELSALPDAEHARILIVTGPNMGGKSTVMRQTALIVILAQMGSYVPASRARIGIADRVFTRVGAADDLARGDSTFMVEMRETAEILGGASDRSLVLLDEIGRGTATFDGLALAWAITEFLHDQIGCRAMFATHYHELCGLEGQLGGVRNVHVAVHEQRGRIVFLYRLEPGPAGRSYGIQVGRLAGLPARALRRASRILERLEAQERAGQVQLDLFAPRKGSSEEESAAAAAEHDEVLDALLALEPDELSPRQAHQWLRDWCERLRGR
jgi:DNA mismatch repair protein MutS